MGQNKKLSEVLTTNRSPTQKTIGLGRNLSVFPKKRNIDRLKGHFTTFGGSDGRNLNSLRSYRRLGV